MDIRRMLGVAGVVAASGVLMAGQPAFAQDTTWSVSETVSDGSGHELTETANGQILASDETTLTIGFACTARSLFAAATSVTECYLEGADGTRYDAANVGAMPGPAAAYGDAVVAAPRQAYKVCVDALTFLTTGALLEAPLACSPQT